MPKKSFKEQMQEKAINPALQIISTPEAPSEPQETPKRTRSKKTGTTSSSTLSKATPAKRADPLFDEETKSRRLQLLLTPSLYEAVRGAASEEHMSVNEYINTVLRDAISRK